MRDMQEHLSWQAAAQRLLPTPRVGSLPLPSQRRFGGGAPAEASCSSSARGRSAPVLLSLNASSTSDAGVSATGGNGSDVGDCLSFELLPTASHLGISLDELEQAADARAALAWVGGESAAKRRLKYYLWVADCLGRQETPPPHPTPPHPTIPYPNPPYPTPPHPTIPHPNPPYPTPTHPTLPHPTPPYPTPSYPTPPHPTPPHPTPHPPSYFETRNGMLGSDYSSKVGSEKVFCF